MCRRDTWKFSSTYCRPIAKHYIRCDCKYFHLVRLVVLSFETQDSGGLVDLESRTSDGRTPLLVAAHYGKARIVEALLAINANVEARAWQENYSAVHFAAVAGHCDVLRVLARFGEDMNQRCEGGRTPLMLAAAEGYAEACRTLIDWESDSTIVCDAQKSALDYAIDQQHPLAIAVLGGHSDLAL